MAALLLSKTRTPLIAGTIALGLAVLLLGLSHARARRVLAALVLTGPLLYLAAAPFVRSYLRRDQTDAVFSTLTGRTSAWAKVHAFPRTGFQELFGMGYGDKSIDGIPIDNGYLATYHEVGKVGLVVVVTILVVLAARALVEATPANRALAVFLVTFVAIASYTETGIGDMSAYVMHLVLAGAMVVTPMALDRHARAERMPESGRSLA
jgi:O-antigen ligase